MANNYQAQANNITATSMAITIYSATSPATTTMQLTVRCIGPKGLIDTKYLVDPGTLSGGVVGTVNFLSLEPETTYRVALVIPNSGTKTFLFTTLIDPDTPRVATQQQWEDLASRVDSANGKIKTRSGAPTTSTVGTVGQLLEDTTNGKLYICTSASGSTYTWTEVGSGGGGGGEFVTLTDSDANWTDPDSGDDYIALWLLPTGKYMLDENATVQLLPGLTNYGGTLQVDYTFWATTEPIALITNPQEQGSESDVTVFSSNQTMSFAVSYDTGEFSSTTILAQPFAGTDGQNDGIAGLVPAPTSGDADKFLKSDGTWDTAGSSITPVQTTGTSQTDVMSQNAVTSMIFADPSTTQNVSIGNSNAGPSSVSVGASAYGAGSSSVAVGTRANTYGGTNAIALGFYARARQSGAIGIGWNTNSGQDGNIGSIALGAYSSAPNVGEMNIGSSQTSYGYNNTNYRLLSGVHDPVNAHDAATKGYVDSMSSYSTSEVNTGATWIDGSAIYKKTVDVGSLPDTTTKTVAHGITGLSVLVRLEGEAHGGSSFISLPLVTNTDSNQVYVLVDSTNITIGAGTDRSAFSGYVTLYYTKSS